MADFFTRLAARTLGSANTVQPLLPSLFAPEATLIDAEPPAEQERADHDLAALQDLPQPAVPQQQTSASTESTIMSHQAHAAHQNEPGSATRRRDDRAQPQMGTAVPSNAQPNPAIAEKRAEPQQHSDIAAQIEPHTASASVAPRQRSTRRIAAAAPELAQTEQLFSVPTITPSRSAIETTSTQPQAATSDRLPAAQPALASLLPPSDEPAGMRAQTSDEPAETRAQTRLAATTQPRLVAQPQPTPPAQPTPRAPEPPSAQPAPQIRVAIGRIEVRAVTPAPAPTPQPTPKAQPHLSLDEYLRAQNGGRR